jgi:hypothetical protein
MTDFNGYEERGIPKPFPRQLRWAILVLAILFVAWILSDAVVNLWLNVKEFGELFIRPIYFWLYSGLLLSALALVRIDLKNRRSLALWFFHVLVNSFKYRSIDEESEQVYFKELSFGEFKLSWSRFIAWQITKVFLGFFFFTNVFFGMAFYAIQQGWDPNLASIWKIFSLPFITPPFSGEYATSIVIPMVPALTLLVGSVLSALGIRLILLVGFTQIVRIWSPRANDQSKELTPIGWKLAILWALLGLGALWTFFNSFFTAFINYNTRYTIVGLAIIGCGFLVLAFLDWKKNSNKTRRFFSLRRIGIKVAPILLIVLIAFSIMAINDSIADARKVEWLGPYTAQQIAVNRYFAELDEVEEKPYVFSFSQLSSEQIYAYSTEHRDLIDAVRLWDWSASYSKLKPEIGLIPYVDYQDSDIIRFDDKLFWAASMKPLLPDTVRPGDRWYTQHLVYTHVPNGFYLLDAQEGNVVETSQYFDQRRIYYGEGGLFEESWAAYPENRDKSDELEGYFYGGDGGITAPPPLSWIYEFNFFLAFRDQEMHLIRYRDIYDRMELLFPYFEYNFQGKYVDTFPVTDGQSTYYVMPLIVRLDTWNVPWSRGNNIMRLVGYALIDIYTSEIKLLITGNDYFSELFKSVYSEFIITQVPVWLEKQLRYPQELFEWRVGMFNYYHVEDPSTFIVAKEFFEVPEGLTTYYIFSKPPGFDEMEYIGLLSLELKGARGRNLAGYMVVRNDIPYTGDMIFYQVSFESDTKLLGPTGTKEALEKNSEFAQLKTLLREPRIGDNILYRIGDHDVYFIPVYTAGHGGVVTEMGVVACIGAAFTGNYFVGLGNNAEEAFIDYLAQFAGVSEPVEPEEGVENLEGLMQQARDHLQAYQELLGQGKYQEAGEQFESFLDVWEKISGQITGIEEEEIEEEQPIE